MDGIPLDSSYTWTTARRLGATRRQIASDGHLLGRGLYVSRSAKLDLETPCRAWTKVLPADAAFGLRTAAGLLGAYAQCPPIIDVVLRPRRVLPQRSGIAIHARRPADEDVVQLAGLRLTPGAPTFLDMAAVLPPHELLALGDACCARRSWTPTSSLVAWIGPTGYAASSAHVPGPPADALGCVAPGELRPVLAAHQ